MMALAATEVMGGFITFCRIGGCLMIAPGFSSNRIPVKARLFIALGLSAACLPLTQRDMPADIGALAPLATVRLIVSELLIGAVFGLLCRIYFFALQTLATAAAMGMGFNGIPGADVADDGQSSPVVGLITLAATALLFILDLHHEILRGLLGSYAAVPVGEWFGPQLSLMRIVDQTAAGFTAALRICAPFIVYSVMVNIAVGFANKLTPQIPAFFIATPFIMFGGLLILHSLTPEFLSLFMEALRTAIVLR